MDAVCDPSVHTIWFMKSAQVGWTEILLNVAGYFIDQDPAPILLVQPTVDMAKAWSKDRLAPALRDTPALRGKVTDASVRDSGNTVLHKVFPGGHITMGGANSPAGLASRPIRIVLLDEVDRYPPSAGAEGDPVRLAQKRSTTFWNRKTLAGATPTVSGRSRVEDGYETSDKRRFFVPCPHCDHAQTLRWEQVRWPKDNPAEAAYVCEECGVAWTDMERWRAVRKGEWVATAPFNGIAGFHLSEIYSPWVRLEETVRSFLDAKASPEQLQTWVNTSLGETWKEQGEAPDWQRLYDRREAWRDVPAGAQFITAGVDVQKDRVEASIWAWGVGKESWLAEHRVIEGDTSRGDVWAALDGLLNETWRTEDERELPALRVAIDSGYATSEVYAWARGKPPGRVMVVKGQESGSALVGQPRLVDVTVGGRRLARGVRVWPVATGIIKAEFYGWLNLAAPTGDEPHPSGYVHISTAIDDEGCKQLVAEQLVTKIVKGYRRTEWQKTRDRNELLDCRVYARAAAATLGLDRGYAERLKAAAEREPPPEDPPVTSTSTPRRRVTRTKRSWVRDF